MDQTNRDAEGAIRGVCVIEGIDLPWMSMLGSRVGDQPRILRLACVRPTEGRAMGNAASLCASEERVKLPCRRGF